VVPTRGDLASDSTYFLFVDTVGAGRVRFETAAGWAVTFPMDRRLVELCEAIASADRDGDDRFGGRALRLGVGDDSVAARARRYPATTITCADDLDIVPGVHTAADVPDRIDPAALERAHGFALELVRLLDRDIGRAAGSR
jgi:hypothetical protein